MSDTSMRTKLVLGLCALVLTLGLGAKVMRYTAPPKRMNQSFDERLTTFVQAGGWQRQATDASTENKAVQIITFSKANCPAPLRVSIVGTTSGLESYLRQKFGDDIAFVQHGTVRDHPSLVRYQIANSWSGMLARLSGTTPERQPILAITPAPRQTGNACAGPTINEWETL